MYVLGSLPKMWSKKIGDDRKGVLVTGYQRKESIQSSRAFDLYHPAGFRVPLSFHVAVYGRPLDFLRCANSFEHHVISGHVIYLPAANRSLLPINRWFPACYFFYLSVLMCHRECVLLARIILPFITP